jgi:hypothetical protein
MASFFPRRRVSFPPVLARFWIWTLALFALACAVVWVRGIRPGRPYPYSTFLFDPAYLHSDFGVFMRPFGELWLNMPAYPPASAVVGWVLAHSLGLTGYLGLLIAFAIALTALFVRAAVEKGVGTVTACAFGLTLLTTSYPLMFVVNRANIEGAVWVVVSLGLLAVARGHWRAASVLIGFATAMKIFPFVLFALFLSKKKWRELGLGVAVALLASVGALRIVGPSVRDSFHAVQVSIAGMAEFFLYHDRALQWGFNHSLFSIPKQLIYLFSGGQAQSTTDSYVMRTFVVYQVFAALAGLALYFGTIRKRPLLNQIIALTVCSIWLPWFSGDYTLVHLYVPFGLLVFWVLENSNAGEERYKPGEMLKFLIPFAILFTPESYLVVLERGFGGQVKSIALLVLLDASLHFPLRSTSAEAGDPVAGAPTDRLAERS